MTIIESQWFNLKWLGDFYEELIKTHSSSSHKKDLKCLFSHNIHRNLMIQSSFSQEQFSGLKMLWIIDFLLMSWEKKTFQIIFMWGWGVGFVPFFKKVTCTFLIKYQTPYLVRLLTAIFFFLWKMCHLAAHKTCCVVETICYIPTFTNLGIKQPQFIVKLLLNGFI